MVLKENGRVIGEVYSLKKGVNKGSFKVGSLDQLMELIEVF
jgi:hypothetical protein